MSCEELERELVAYHFGVVSEETRGMLEEHLPGCPGCVAAFLALKRDIETAASASSPSPALRRRLRRAVAREIGAEEAAPSWSWWERPFAFAFAGASVLVVMVAVAFLGTQPGTMPHTLRAEAAERGPLPPAP
jgi:anti-sigma factor RsiW